MSATDDSMRLFSFPTDILDDLSRIARELGESPQDVAIAALEHFTKISPEQRKACMRATSIRRRGA